MYKIEKNIPYPVRGLKTKYPFAQMEIGDSFVATAHRNSVAVAAIRYGKKTGARFTVSTHGGVVRCWRVT